MDYITINGKSIPYPNDFKMTKVPRIVSEIETMNGTTIADIDGWKYDETTLQWDTLLDDDLQNLLDAISTNIFSITFEDIDGQHTVQAILMGRTNVKTPLFKDGNLIWSDIQISLSFPECYS